MCVHANRRVSVHDLERVFISGRHRSGSSDLKVLEQFLDALNRDQLQPEAIVFYGSCLERSDVMYLGPFVQAVQRMLDCDATIVEKLRLRPRMNFQDMQAQAVNTAASLRDVLAEIGKRLQSELPPPEHSDRLMQLVQRLDA